MVFPRPISSARMPFNLLSSMATSHSSPMCWYSRNLCRRRNGTLVFTWEAGREGEGEGRRERECMQLYDSVLEQALSYCTSVVANVIPLG